MGAGAPHGDRLRIRWGLRLAVACGLLGAAGSAAAATGGGSVPVPLSRSSPIQDVRSTYGSGDFGVWETDGWGLPDYRYDVDEQSSPIAAQPELDGGTAAQHQVGNDHIKDFVFNDGYSQFWSQDRLFQYADLWQPASRHYGGGFGWLRVGRRVASTLYLDRSRGVPFVRRFGIGYASKQTALGGVDVAQTTYAPFGDDPVVLDDVELTNTRRTAVRATWFEYWDVNPYDQTGSQAGLIGVARPRWDAARRILYAAQVTPHDPAPLSIFAAPLRGPVDGWDTSVAAFFGAGTRARPAEVAADRLSQSLPAPSAPGLPSHALYVFRAPVTLAPHERLTLRYLYGMARPDRIRALVAGDRAARDPLTSSQRAWSAWLPKADFGPGYAWVARELTWDAYLLRSATVYEAACGYHTITQGGYYQYADGFNWGSRSWLHYLLPMVYADPELARQIIEYATALQPEGSLQLPYGTGPLCTRSDLGTSDDLDFWLLLAASEYGLASRDTTFFDRQIPFYRSTTKVSIWEHLELAFRHQESLREPDGSYASEGFGDWDDLSPQTEGLTASTLVTAQLAYAYPRLAELARLRGDGEFARSLDRAGAADLAALRAQWVARGWYARGYAGSVQLGSGVIFGEPQPWAILAGAPSVPQARLLVANIGRYLDGVGAPASLGGPERLGTALVPAAHDPGVTQTGPPAVIDSAGGPVQGAAEAPGGIWFDPNGWLTWAYASLDGVLPGARQLAWSEYLRNTLANHATVYPRSWDGTISVDDVCNAFYSRHPELCGNGLSEGTFAGQITEQPTWMVMDAVRLAGITPVEDGYDIAPHLPLSRFSLRLPEVGIASAPGSLRGYIVITRGGSLSLHVAVPSAARHLEARAWVAPGRIMRPVAARRAGDIVSFTLPAVAGRPADWAVTW